ncbi:MAG: RDD family protein [Tetrasphaera sp.]|nr:RDD family protein [Tetrasphaera sp.]
MSRSTEPTRGETATTTPYAGSLLGLPASGPGSLAPFARRFVAVLIDWVLAQLVVAAFAWRSIQEGERLSFVVLGVFGLLTWVSLSFVAATFGHFVMGLQLRQVRPGVGPLQALVRTVLLCLFLPAVLTAKDGRGLHDVAAGTVLVRR